MERAIGYIGVHPDLDLLKQCLRSAPKARGTYYRALRPGYGRKPLQAVDDVALVPQLRRDGQPLLEQLPSPLVVALSLRQSRQGVERHGDGLSLAYLP